MEKHICTLPPFHLQVRRPVPIGVPAEMARRDIAVHDDDRAAGRPDRDVGLGIVGADERIVTTDRMTPQGPSFDVRKVPA